MDQEFLEIRKKRLNEYLDKLTEDEVVSTFPELPSLLLDFLRKDSEPQKTRIFRKVAIWHTVREYLSMIMFYRWITSSIRYWVLLNQCLECVFLHLRRDSRKSVPNRFRWVHLLFLKQTRYSFLCFLLHNVLYTFRVRSRFLWTETIWLFV